MTTLFCANCRRHVTALHTNASGQSVCSTCLYKPSLHGRRARPVRLSIITQRDEMERELFPSEHKES